MKVDQYQEVRSLPFPAICQVLGLDVSQYKLHKGGKEYQGKCPVHNAKQNNNSFSYNIDGRWHCFSCDAKGSGSIDLTKAVLKIGFQPALERLKAVSYTPIEKTAVIAVSD